jgi:hypothetical protein
VTLPNGKTGEALRWVAMLAIAGLVSYYTTTATIQARLAVAESEIKLMRDDVRELRADVKMILQAVR